MLVKINSIDTDNNKVKLTHLDIDDHGSLIPLEELELCISANDDSIIQALKNHSYACVFTEGNIDDNNSGSYKRFQSADYKGTIFLLQESYVVGRRAGMGCGDWPG